MNILRTHYGKPQPAPRRSKLYPDAGEEIDLALLKNNLKE
jgi:hypothetical protein